MKPSHILSAKGGAKLRVREEERAAAMGDDKPSKLVILLYTVVNTCAFGLAVAAECRRNIGRVVPDKYDELSYCVYDSDMATGYGAAAAVLLLGSHLLLHSLSRCLCCGAPLSPGASRASAIIFFFLSWITFFIVEACMLAGAVRNAYHTKYRGSFIQHNLSCATLRKGVFAAAAAFTIFTTTLTLLYYISFTKARSKSGGWKPYTNEPTSGIGMSSLPK